MDCSQQLTRTSRHSPKQTLAVCEARYGDGVDEGRFQGRSHPRDAAGSPLYIGRYPDLVDRFVYDWLPCTRVHRASCSRHMNDESVQFCVSWTSTLLCCACRCYHMLMHSRYGSVSGLNYLLYLKPLQSKVCSQRRLRPFPHGHSLPQALTLSPSLRPTHFDACRMALPDWCSVLARCGRGI